MATTTTAAEAAAAGRAAAASVRVAAGAQWPSEDGSSARSSLAERARLVETAATRAAVLAKEGGGGAAVVSDGLLATLEQAAVGYCAGAGAGCARGAGTALKAALRQHAAALASAVAELCEAATADDAARCSAACGKVWERCREAAKLPADNRVAVGRALARAGAGLKDVLREADEMLAAAEEGGAGGVAPGEGEADDDDDELDDDDDLDLDDTLDAGEAELARAARPVLEAAVGLLRATIRAITVSTEPTTEDGVAAADVVLESMKGLCVAGEALGAALFSPQDPAEIRLHAEACAARALDAAGVVDGLAWDVPRAEVDALAAAVSALVEGPLRGCE